MSYTYNSNCEMAKDETIKSQEKILSLIRRHATFQFQEKWQ